MKKSEMDGACSTCEEKRGVYRILVGKPEGKRELGDPGVYGRMTLRWILRKWVVLHRLY